MFLVSWDFGKNAHHNCDILHCVLYLCFAAGLWDPTDWTVQHTHSHLLTHTLGLKHTPCTERLLNIRLQLSFKVPAYIRCLFTYPIYMYTRVYITNPIPTYAYFILVHKLACICVSVHCFTTVLSDSCCPSHAPEVCLIKSTAKTKWAFSTWNPLFSCQAPRALTNCWKISRYACQPDGLWMHLWS